MKRRGLFHKAETREIEEWRWAEKIGKIKIREQNRPRSVLLVQGVLQGQKRTPAQPSQGSHYRELITAVISSRSRGASVPFQGQKRTPAGGVQGAEVSRFLLKPDWQAPSNPSFDPVKFHHVLKSVFRQALLVMADYIQAFQNDRLVLLDHKPFVPYAFEELGVLLALVDREEREDRRIALALFDGKGYLPLHGKRLQYERRQRGGGAPARSSRVFADGLYADRPCGRQEDEQLAEVVDEAPKRLTARPVARGAIAIRLLFGKSLMKFFWGHVA